MKQNKSIYLYFFGLILIVKAVTIAIIGQISAFGLIFGSLCYLAGLLIGAGLGNFGGE